MVHWYYSNTRIAIGTTGPQGPRSTGTQGTKGTDGNFGGNSFDFTFDTSTTDSDPGTGKIKLNQTDQNTSTIAYIDITDDHGNSIDSTLDTLDSVTSAIKGHIRIANRLDHTEFITFAITDLTDVIHIGV